MIEISFAKLVLLALVALIVLGPEKLPGAARTAGALLRRVRNGWESVRSEVERELEVEEIKRAAREAAAHAEAVQAEFKDSVRQADASVRDTVAEVKAAVAPEPTATGAAEAAAAVEPASPPLPALESVADAGPDLQQELPLDEPSAAPVAKESAHGGR